MITVVRKTHIYYFSCLKFFKYVLYKNEKKNLYTPLVFIRVNKLSIIFAFYITVDIFIVVVEL